MAHPDGDRSVSIALDTPENQIWAFPDLGLALRSQQLKPSILVLTVDQEVGDSNSPGGTNPRRAVGAAARFPKAKEVRASA